MTRKRVAASARMRPTAVLRPPAIAIVCLRHIRLDPLSFQNVLRDHCALPTDARTGRLPPALRQRSLRHICAGGAIPQAPAHHRLITLIVFVVNTLPFTHDAVETLRRVDSFA